MRRLQQGLGNSHVNSTAGYLQFEDKDLNEIYERCRSRGAMPSDLVLSVFVVHVAFVFLVVFHTPRSKKAFQGEPQSPGRPATVSEKPFLTTLWLPSQKGLFEELPHRHRVTRLRIS